MTLKARAWLALALVASVMCALIFGTAGTMQYWQAWVYISIFLGASVLTTLYLMKNDPALLARRMRGGPTFEREGTQRIIMVFTSLGFIALLVVPALDHRFGWSAVPVWGVHSVSTGCAMAACSSSRGARVVSCAERSTGRS